MNVFDAIINSEDLRESDLPEGEKFEIVDGMERLVDKRLWLFKKNITEIVSLGVIGLRASSPLYPVRLEGYQYEAANSYIFYSPISCINSCASAIEQVFRAHYVEEEGIDDEERERRELELRGELPGHRKLTFGTLIRKFEDKNSLDISKFISEAYLLNDIRNTLGIHTGYISHVYPYNKKQIERYWNQIKEDLYKIKKLCERSFNDEQTIKLLSKPLFRITNRLPQEVSLLDILLEENARPEDIRIDTIENGISENYRKIFALKSYEIMKTILEGLYS